MSKLIEGLQNPYIRLGKTAVQGIATALLTTVILDAPLKISSGVFSYSSVTNLVTIKRSGIYLFNFYCSFAASAVGVREWVISITDGVTTPIFRNSYAATTGVSTEVRGITCIYPIQKFNATVAFRVLQNSGAALNINANSCEASIVRLSDI